MCPDVLKMPSNTDYPAVLSGVMAFSIWGCLVIFWYPLRELPAIQILAYRVIFSILTLLPIVYFFHRFTEIKKIIQDPKILISLCISALLIGASWYLYIWAVVQGRILELSMGYYINPLFNVLLGAIIFKERPKKLQILALFIAFMGILWSIFVYGKFPYVSIALALLFSLYGLARKTITVDPLAGLFVETLVLFPIALLWLILAFPTIENHFLSLSTNIQLLIISTGFFTSIPLMLFAFAARRLELSTLGIIQYISPSTAFLLGVFVIGEKISTDMLITFVCIWIALILYTFSAITNITSQNKNKLKYKNIH